MVWVGCEVFSWNIQEVLKFKKQASVLEMKESLPAGTHHLISAEQLRGKEVTFLITLPFFIFFVQVTHCGASKIIEIPVAEADMRRFVSSSQGDTLA